MSLRIILDKVLDLFIFFDNVYYRLLIVGVDDQALYNATTNFFLLIFSLPPPPHSLSIN